MTFANLLVEFAIDEPRLLLLGLVICGAGIVLCAWCIARGYPRDRRFD